MPLARSAERHWAAGVRRRQWPGPDAGPGGRPL